jgi:anti-sigma regulatory factor (Ser/Thr protein kinase)
VPNEGAGSLPEKVDLELELPRATAASQLARRALRRLCADRIRGDLLADAVLLVGELTSNAVVHGRGNIITLRARLNEDRLFVEVIDAGAGFERVLRRSDFDQVGGWGLDIVEQLSSRWGVYEGTTHVWFELELPGPRLVG